MSVLRPFDPWHSPLCTCPFKYSLHPYTGCSHFCLYCYATSYIGRKPSMPKEEFLNALTRDMRRARRNAIVELSSSSDPYPPLEAWMRLTRKTLELLGAHGFRILITTKSDIVVRDIDLLAKYPSSVMITITTLNDNLARRLEPGAPPPSRRIAAVRTLSKNGIPVGVRVDPIIPFINDDPEDLRELIGALKDAGALQVTVSTYKAKWDSLRRIIDAFPDVASRLKRLYVEEGEGIHGYMYLPKSLRETLLKPVVEEAGKRGLFYATCREGLESIPMKAPSCDGSGLIILHPLLSRQDKASRWEKWMQGSQ